MIVEAPKKRDTEPDGVRESLKQSSPKVISTDPDSGDKVEMENQTRME